MSETLEFLRPDLQPATTATPESTLPWLTRHDEGELAVDVYETDQAVFIKTAIAGVKPENLQLALSHDMLTIRGKRTADAPDETECKYLSRECHWGAFSRSIILPADINVSKAEAIFQTGILAIKLPKMKSDTALKVKVVED